jgi:hypothetical protein
MRFSNFIGFSSLGIIFFIGLLFTSCGSFQNSSYYSDGIYNSDNVIVIRRNKKTPATNAYSQYFDEQANQYNWDNNSDNVALTNVDSLNQGNLNNYQSNSNWGGGNKTTQIIIQSTPLNFGFGGNWWGYGGFYDPYVAYWDYNFYNPYRWNRFAWGFNRPFFNDFYPYYGYGFYGNPYFYGGGFWNGYGYAYNNPYRRPFNRVNNRRTNFRRNRAYSSSYRGQAAASGIRRTTVNTRAQRNNNGTSASLTNRNSRSSRQSNSVRAGTAPTQTQQGRTASVRQNINLDNTKNQVSRTQITQENQNRSQIERVVRQMQGKGFDIQVINNTEQARRFSQQNQFRNVVNQGGRSNTQVISRNNNSNNTTKEYSSSRKYRNNSSTRSQSSNFRSSNSRSHIAPARVSSGGGRSFSSGRSSSGRSSSGGRRQ